MGSLKDIEKRIESSIGKTKTIKTEFDHLTVVGEDQNVRFDPQRATHLQTVYTAIKGSYEKNKFRKKTMKPSIITIFNKIAQKLSEYEREIGVEIDNALFVVALFKKYGKNTYPGHLLGKAAIDIYFEKLGELYDVRHVPSKDSDRRVLKYLCEVRRETEAEVMHALEHAGIFSSAFIKKWKLSHKRKI